LAEFEGGELLPTTSPHLIQSETPSLKADAHLRTSDVVDVSSSRLAQQRENHKPILKSNRTRDHRQTLRFGVAFLNTSA
jgi:hypothetical protein